MIGFGKFKKAKECFLALDIGTEAVKALVFEKENQKYSIIGSALQYFDESKPFDNDKVIFNVKEEALSRVREKPKELLLSLPPDILRSRVRDFLFIRQKKEVIIAKEEARSIVEIVFKEIGKEITERFQDIQFVENKILEIKIDGYEVPDLLGYSGENLKFKVLASFLPKGYLENFGKNLKNFNLKSRIVCPVENLNAFGLDDGVFIDIGGEITQVCLTKDNKIEIVDEFEMGGKNFSRVFSQNLGMPAQEARLFKEKYSRSDLAEGTRSRVKELLNPIAKEWYFNLKSKLKTAKGLLPPAFFLFGGGSQLPEIKELIEGEGEEVRFLAFKDFKDIADFTHSINSPQFITSILLFYGK